MYEGKVQQSYIGQDDFLRIGHFEVASLFFSGYLYLGSEVCDSALHAYGVWVSHTFIILYRTALFVSASDIHGNGCTDSQMACFSWFCVLHSFIELRILTLGTVNSYETSILDPGQFWHFTAAIDSCTMIERYGNDPGHTTGGSNGQDPPNPRRSR